MESVGFNMKKRKNDFDTAVRKTKAEDQLDYNEVSRIYNFMIIGKDVKSIFNKVSSDKK